MPEEKCNCAICKNRIDFELPKEILYAINNEELVIFAGAGISTENKGPYSISLFQEIWDELNAYSEQGLPFSKVMSKYCKVNGKAKLFQEIKKKLNYIKSFPELYGIATSFHKELSTIYQIKEIITTNWDDFFEIECGATPFVTSKDFIFGNLPGRKVFKIHGSINNLASIVVTHEDYTKCYEKLNNGLMGNSLRLILATKVVLFIGYSFNDEDFIKIYNILKKEMGDLMPRSYIVTLNRDSAEKFKEMGLFPIVTDGTYFIQTIKSHLVESDILLPDDRFIGIYKGLSKVREAHNKLGKSFDITKNPEIIYTLSYQDGLIHAFERILAMKNTGEYSFKSNIYGIIQLYEYKLDDKMDKKNFGDVAYIEGYLNGLLYLYADDSMRDNLPLFYLFGYESEIQTFEEYKKLHKDTQINQKEAFEYVSKLAKKLDKGYVFHHPPFV